MLANHYEVLSFPSPPLSTLSISQEDIKTAYRRALLQHHPDKLIAAHNPVLTPRYTIDEITDAYKTLSDPASRIEFDRLLRLESTQSQSTAAKSPTGLETVDLDDLAYDRGKGYWYRSCRCGTEGGFLVTEEDLEKESEYGEMLTGCNGCSLWLRVMFQQVD